MPGVIDVQREWRTSWPGAESPALLAFAGAVLLMCAPLLPGLSKLVVLPALLLAPGYALLRLFGHSAGQRSISLAVPLSLVLAVCASLVLNVSGVRLGTLSLGLLLGAVTVLCLAGSYARQLAAGPQEQYQATSPPAQEPDRSDPSPGDRRHDGPWSLR
ncbi:MAG: DUF1616 domain-containing protein [Nocardiopsaceae bacterium]|jgi:hypothetical protein|nr:DUF1616 domain-containing protein [Nocardiopsaceae bacterium]